MDCPRDGFQILAKLLCLAVDHTGSTSALKKMLALGTTYTSAAHAMGRLILEIIYLQPRQLIGLTSSLVVPDARVLCFSDSDSKLAFHLGRQLDHSPLSCIGKLFILKQILKFILIKFESSIV